MSQFGHCHGNNFTKREFEFLLRYAGLEGLSVPEACADPRFLSAAHDFCKTIPLWNAKTEGDFHALFAQRAQAYKFWKPEPGDAAGLLDADARRMEAAKARKPILKRVVTFGVEYGSDNIAIALDGVTSDCTAEIDEGGTFLLHHDALTIPIACANIRVLTEHVLGLTRLMEQSK